MNSLPNNVKFEILLKADYATTINLCQTDKSFDSICQDEYLWARKAELESGITPTELALLPAENNRIRYDWIVRVDPNYGLVKASELGVLSLVEYFISVGGEDFNQAMVEASGNGHLDIVEFLLEKGATDYDDAMIEAGKKWLY